MHYPPFRSGSAPHTWQARSRRSEDHPVSSVTGFAAREASSYLAGWHPDSGNEREHAERKRRHLLPSERPAAAGCRIMGRVQRGCDVPITPDEMPLTRETLSITGRTHERRRWSEVGQRATAVAVICVVEMKETMGPGAGWRRPRSSVSCSPAMMFYALRLAVTSRAWRLDVQCKYLMSPEIDCSIQRSGVSPNAYYIFHVSEQLSRVKISNTPRLCAKGCA